jgi:hypothetical protein
VCQTVKHQVRQSVRGLNTRHYAVQHVSSDYIKRADIASVLVHLERLMTGEFNYTERSVTILILPLLGT